MKSILSFSTSPLFLIIVLWSSISGCHTSTPAPSATELVKAKLIAATSWNLQSAMVDGVDRSSLYQGLSLSFKESAYYSTNGGVAWKSSGTWTFNSTDGTTILRDDGLIISISVTDTTLKLTYSLAQTTLSGGRDESIKGVHVVTFKKQ